MVCMQLVTSLQPLSPFDCIHHNSVACCFSTVWLLASWMWQKWRVMCFVPSPLSLCRGCFFFPLSISFLSLSLPLLFSLPDLLQAKSTSTCRTRNPKLGASVRVSLSAGLQPTLTSLFWSSCTTLYFSVRRNTTGMLHAGYFPVLHTPNANLRQCWRTWGKLCHRHRENVSLMTN